MARKNQSAAEPPDVNFIDRDSALTPPPQPPPRYSATPSVFQIPPTSGARSTALRASATARAGSRSSGSEQVARYQARSFRAFGSSAAPAAASLSNAAARAV